MSLSRSAAFAACIVAAPAFAQQQYAQVISATPVYREVRVEVPRDECRDVEVVQRNPNKGADTAVGAVIGGVAGGVLGHQIGKGRGKDVATAVGAVAGVAAGASVGNSIAGPDQRQVQRQCQRVIDYRTEQRQDGYDVAYRYGGAIYHTHTARNPGSQIPIRISVTPLAQ